MRRIGWITLLTTTTLLGGLAGWSIGRSSHPAGTSDPRHPPHAAAADASPSTPAAMQADGPIDDDDSAQVRRARNDPAYLNTLLGRYITESQPDSKGALLAVLVSVANDDVMHFGLRQLGSQDPQMRRDGIALLEAFPPDTPGVRDAALKQLASERDSQLQAALIELLEPTGMPQEDAAPVLARLNTLVRSDDPEIRATSLSQLAQWDDSPAIESTVQQALLDTAPQVRQAAIASIGMAHLRSGAIKDTLLDIALDPSREETERQDAAMILEQFRLDRADHALLTQATLAFADSHHDHP